jgi:hypothetical protein
MIRYFIKSAACYFIVLSAIATTSFAQDLVYCTVFSQERVTQPQIMGGTGSADVTVPQTVLLPGDECNTLRKRTQSGDGYITMERVSHGPALTPSKMNSILAAHFDELNQNVDDLTAALTNYRTDLVRADSSFKAYREDVTAALNNLNDEIITSVIEDAKQEQIREVLEQVFDDHFQAEMERRIQAAADSIEADFEQRVEEEVRRRLKEEGESNGEEQTGSGG